MKLTTPLPGIIKKSNSYLQVSLDSEGFYLASNDLFSSKFFSTKNEWKGASFYNKLSESSLELLKDTLKKCGKELGEVFTVELEHSDKKNKTVTIEWAITALSLNNQILYSARGTVKNFPSTSRYIGNVSQHQCNQIPVDVLQNIFDTSPDLICTISEEGRFITINNSCKTLLGYSPEELTGRKMMELVYKDDVDKTLSASKGIKEARELKNFENRCIRKDGSIITLFWSAKWSNAHQLTYCTARDGSEIKEYEEAIKASDKRYRLLFLKNPLPMWIYEVGSNRFLEVNEAAVNHYGYSYEEFLSMTLKDIRPKEDVEKLLKDADERSASPSYKSSWRHRKKSGEMIDVEVTAYPIEFEGKKAKFVLANDITEHLNAQKELIKSNSRYIYASKASFDAIWDWDMKTNELYWSDSYETLFGYKALNYREPLPIWLNKIHPEDRSRVEKNFVQAIKANNNAWEDEYRFRKADGNYAYVIDRGIIMRNEKNKAYRMIGVLHDYTERQKSQQSLKELNVSLEKRAAQLASSNQELERFAYVASHDLQEPLRMVSSFLQLLQKKYKAQLDDKANEYIHYAVDGAERMKVLILDLLKYSRVNTIKEEHELVDLNELCKNILFTFKQIIDEAGATIEVENLPQVMGAKTQLVQLFQNLIGNAIKYRKQEPPFVKIGCSEEKDHWQFYVKDNGIGIDPRFYHKVFVIFQRLHHKDEYSGTGIGLAICKKIVEHHNGKIWVDSELGSGSTFYFTLKKSLKKHKD